MLLKARESWVDRARRNARRREQERREEALGNGIEGPSARRGANGANRTGDADGSATSRENAGGPGRGRTTSYTRSESPGRKPSQLSNADAVGAAPLSGGELAARVREGARTRSRALASAAPAEPQSETIDFGTDVAAVRGDRNGGQVGEEVDGTDRSKAGGEVAVPVYGDGIGATAADAVSRYVRQVTVCAESDLRMWDKAFDALSGRLNGPMQSEKQVDDASIIVSTVAAKVFDALQGQIASLVPGGGAVKFVRDLLGDVTKKLQAAHERAVRKGAVYDWQTWIICQRNQIEFKRQMLVTREQELRRQVTGAVRDFQEVDRVDCETYGAGDAEQCRRSGTGEGGVIVGETAAYLQSLDAAAQALTPDPRGFAPALEKIVVELVKRSPADVKGDIPDGRMAGRIYLDMKLRKEDGRLVLEGPTEALLEMPGKEHMAGAVSDALNLQGKSIADLGIEMRARVEVDAGEGPRRGQVTFLSVAAPSDIFGPAATGTLTELWREAAPLIEQRLGALRIVKAHP